MCARPLRIQYPGAFYHVMNRGNSFQKTFRSVEDYGAFLKLLCEAVELWKIKIHAFSLMPNHYHLLIETPLGNLARSMRHINGVYTQRYNKKWKQDGHLFRGRYKSILVDEEAYLVELLRYIHLNPVRAKLVAKPEDYKWSSHRFYLGAKGAGWLTTVYLLSYFGKKMSRARRKLHEFVLAGVPESLDFLLQGKKWPSVFSTAHFEDWVEWNFVKDMEDKEVQYQPQKPKVFVVGDLEKILAEVLDVSWQEIKNPVGYQAKKLRKIAIRALHQYTNCCYGDICKRLGFLNASTISRAVKDQSIVADPLWKGVMHEIQNAHCKT